MHRRQISRPGVLQPRTPTSPILSFATPNSAAWLRTYRIARAPSSIGEGKSYRGPSRYSSTNAVTPCAFSHRASSPPSFSSRPDCYTRPRHHNHRRCAPQPLSPDTHTASAHRPSPVAHRTRSAVRPKHDRLFESLRRLLTVAGGCAPQAQASTGSRCAADTKAKANTSPAIRDRTLFHRAASITRTACHTRTCKKWLDLMPSRAQGQGKLVPD